MSETYPATSGVPAFSAASAKVLDDSVDVVITAYCEDGGVVDQTVRACLDQDVRVRSVTVVDDGSPEPVAISTSDDQRVRVLRLAANQGISSARNAAIFSTSAPFVACINVEVVPRPDWVRTTVNYLIANPVAGCVCTRVRPAKPGRLWTRWRYRFQEGKYEHDPAAKDGPMTFATGHAVMFRREALDRVKGYEPKFRRICEDGDISRRLYEANWQVHLTLKSECVSTQTDTPCFLARKQIGRGGWVLEEGVDFPGVVRQQTHEMFHRLGRNVLKGRVAFLPVDLYVWASGLRLAFKHRKRFARRTPSTPSPL